MGASILSDFTPAEAADIAPGPLYLTFPPENGQHGRAESWSIDSKISDCYVSAMGSLSIRSLLLLIGVVAFVHFGTPLLADLFFELYHLLKIEALYSIYGALRFATAQYMFWENRWMVTALVGLIGLAILWYRKKRHAAKGAAA